MAESIQRGGTAKVSIAIRKLTHPSQAAWMNVSQIVRHVAEYLTFTDGNNITQPYLLKSWAAIWPCLAIASLVISLNLMADGLRQESMRYQ